MALDESRPWLSILIPAYNAAPYIGECLHSVACQDIDGVEILVTNDCSTDRTADIVERFAAGRPDVALTLLRNETNRGVSATRNRMLDLCAGRHIWFVDADDRMRPDSVGQLKDIVIRHDPDLVICDFANYHKSNDDSFSNPVHTNVFNGPERQLLEDRDMLLGGLFDCGRMYSWSRVAKRSVYGDELRFMEGRYFEDIHIAPLQALRVKNYYYEPTPWIDYRRAAGSIVATMSPRKYSDMLLSMTEIVTELRRPEHGLSRTALSRFDCFCVRQAISCMKTELGGRHIADWAPALTDFLEFPDKVLSNFGWVSRGKPTPKKIWLWFRLKKWQFRARAAIKHAASEKA